MTDTDRRSLLQAVADTGVIKAEIEWSMIQGKLNRTFNLETTPGKGDPQEALIQLLKSYPNLTLPSYHETMKYWKAIFDPSANSLIYQLYVGNVHLETRRLHTFLSPSTELLRAITYSINGALLKFQQDLNDIQRNELLDVQLYYTQNCHKGIAEVLWRTDGLWIVEHKATVDYLAEEQTIDLGLSEHEIMAWCA